MVWEASQKGVPFLGVPGNSLKYLLSPGHSQLRSLHQRSFQHLIQTHQLCLRLLKILDILSHTIAPLIGHPFPVSFSRASLFPKAKTHLPMATGHTVGGTEIWLNQVPYVCFLGYFFTDSTMGLINIKPPFGEYLFIFCNHRTSKSKFPQISWGPWQGRNVGLTS